MNDIVFTNVSFSYGDKKILDSVSFTVKGGAVTSVFAPSGRGKTTVLNLIAGLIKPDFGTISGIEKGRSVSYVFQEDNLFHWMSASQNVALGKSNKTSDELLLSLGLSKDDLDKFPNELSGGMSRRVAIARALYADRDIYLLDEPFSGLDEETKDSVANFVFSKLSGKTVVFVTHDADEIKKYADVTLTL
ncbi:MAG: ATP-binding cassette domain-containing protein [Clostridia bacterium]|nr:ATP-binding cassette domain-containing protein [Clostridia bacterium]